MESKLGSSILNKVKGVGFLDMKEEEVKNAMQYFKMMLMKYKLPEFPYYI